MLDTQKGKKMKDLMKRFINFVMDEEGATAVEYALMVALIASVIIGVVTILGTNSREKFIFVGSTIATAS